MGELGYLFFVFLYFAPFFLTAHDVLDFGNMDTGTTLHASHT